MQGAHWVTPRLVAEVAYAGWTGDGRRLFTDDSTGRVAQVGRHALALLDRFARAQSAHQVCEQVVADVPPVRRGQLRREVLQHLLQTNWRHSWQNRKLWTND